MALPKRRPVRRAVLRRFVGAIAVAVGLIALGAVSGVHGQTPTVGPFPTTAPTVLTVTGTVHIGTAGVPLGENLHVTLHLIRTTPSPTAADPHHADLTELPTHDALVTSSGAYRFENVAAFSGDLCVATLSYEGITQGSVPVTIGSDQTTLDLPITLYAATHDAARIRIAKTQQLLSFAPGNLMQVLETIDFVNTSDRFYVTTQALADGTPLSVSWPLPIGARQIAFDTATANRFGIGGNPNAPIVEDTKPVLPNQVDEVIFSYQLPYTTGAPIDRDYPYATDALQVLLPTEAAVVFNAPNFNFTASQNTTIDPQRPFTAYTLTTPLAAGGRLIYTLKGAPRVINSLSGLPIDSPNWSAILPALAALVVIVVLLLALARRALRRQLLRTP